MNRRETPPPPHPEVPGIRFANIPGCPFYAASTDGKIWSCRRGHKTPSKKWRVLKYQITRQGYPRVSISVDGKQRFRYVQQLILESFVGPCPAGMQACHGPDFTKTNTALNNLRWDTKKANEQDKRISGTYRYGARVSGAKLTDSTIAEILLRAGDLSGSALAREYGVTPTQICKIIKGKAWKHVQRNKSA